MSIQLTESLMSAYYKLETDILYISLFSSLVYSLHLISFLSLGEKKLIKCKDDCMYDNMYKLTWRLS